VAISLAIENRPRRALEREQFVLHYQPKANLLTRKVTGAEALIRWNDPVSGLTPHNGLAAVRISVNVSPLAKWRDNRVGSACLP
jgi:sensor c-di-GMP phosphodiesterase-like protein